MEWGNEPSIFVRLVVIGYITSWLQYCPSLSKWFFYLFQLRQQSRRMITGEVSSKFCRNNGFNNCFMRSTDFILIMMRSVNGEGWWKPSRSLSLALGAKFVVHFGAKIINEGFQKWYVVILRSTVVCFYVSRIRSGPIQLSGSIPCQIWLLPPFCPVINLEVIGRWEWATSCNRCHIIITALNRTAEGVVPLVCCCWLRYMFLVSQFALWRSGCWMLYA